MIQELRPDQQCHFVTHGKSCRSATALSRKPRAGLNPGFPARRLSLENAGKIIKLCRRLNLQAKRDQLFCARQVAVAETGPGPEGGKARGRPLGRARKPAGFVIAQGPFDGPYWPLPTA